MKHTYNPRTWEGKAREPEVMVILDCRVGSCPGGLMFILPQMNTKEQTNKRVNRDLEHVIQNVLLG